MFKVGQKVVCINTDRIRSNNACIVNCAWNLINGKIYTASEPYIDDDGDSVMYIHELGKSKLSVRFRPLDYDFVE